MLLCWLFSIVSDLVIHLYSILVSEEGLLSNAKTKDARVSDRSNNLMPIMINIAKQRNTDSCFKTCRRKAKHDLVIGSIYELKKSCSHACKRTQLEIIFTISA